MKELMIKLGMEEYGAGCDFAISKDSYLEVESPSELDELGVSEDSSDKIYLGSSRKQVYELEDNKTYVIAHGENGSNHNAAFYYHKAYFGLTKNEVIAFLKKHFNDYIGNYITVFEEDTFITVKEYISLHKKSVIADKEMVVVTEGGIKVLNVGDDLSSFDSNSLIFYKDDNVQINALSDDKHYSVLMLSVKDSGSQILSEFMTKQAVLNLVNECINDYAQKTLLIFEAEKSISLKDFCEMEQKKETDNTSQEQESDVCYCCGKNASKAKWRDIVSLRGNLLEVVHVVELDKDSSEGDYNCDSWFDAVEEMFKKNGVMTQEESLNELQDIEFFAAAFADDDIRNLMFSMYFEKFEPGAYCLYCDAAL